MGSGQPCSSTTWPCSPKFYEITHFIMLQTRPSRRNHFEVGREASWLGRHLLRPWHVISPWLWRSLVWPAEHVFCGVAVFIVSTLPFFSGNDHPPVLGERQHYASWGATRYPTSVKAWGNENDSLTNNCQQDSRNRSSSSAFLLNFVGISIFNSFFMT